MAIRRQYDVDIVTRMDDVAAYTSATRAGWDQFAGGRLAQDPQFFLDGGITLDDWEPGLLGSMAGRSLLHLACANGNDTLSWAALGARVTGVDISAPGIEVARRTAAATGLDATFLTGDIYDLPASLPAFDVVYLSGGGICWLPDLRRWAQIVRDHLLPGGTVAVIEHHPLWEVLAAADGRLTPQFDYFSRRPHALADTDASKRPRGWVPEAGLTSFVWPIRDVISSLVGAGLLLTHVSEQPVPAMYEGLGTRAGWLPGCYCLLARRPD
jgi:SAM-dependent methyltransferase